MDGLLPRGSRRCAAAPTVAARATGCACRYGSRAWALEALKGKEGAACPILYNQANQVPKYDYNGLHFKPNYPPGCKDCKKGKPARTSDDGPPKKKGKQSQLRF